MQLFASLAGKRSTQKTTTEKCDSEKSKYRSVEVNINHTGCCEAVQAIAGKRFLSNEVPMLPLIDCDASDCNCSYKLFHDRRADIRRGSDVPFDIASQFCKQDNRSSSSPGRRSHD